MENVKMGITTAMTGTNVWKITGSAITSAQKGGSSVEDTNA